ncbi:hypothetical protein ACOSQ4_025964 [Xanthoceras sorbifolium]
MATLGKQGVIINVGRGALTEKEMVQFWCENEPDFLPKELFQLDNVVLSPHCAVATPECFDALEELIIFNLKAFFSNIPLRSLVKSFDSRNRFIKNHITGKLTFGSLFTNGQSYHVETIIPKLKLECRAHRN